MSGKDIRESVGLLLVVASMVFVGWEIRQNTTAVESATRQGLSEQLTDINLAVLTDEQMPSILLRLRSGALSTDFTGEENQRARLFYFTYIRLINNAYQQVELGVLDEQLYAQLPGGFWSYPYIDAEWPSMSSSFEPSFGEFFEREFLR